MSVLERRVPVLFDPEKYAALEQVARSENKSVGAVIRDAVDEKLARRSSASTAVVKAMFQRADAHPVPAITDWDEVKDSFDRDHLGQIQ